MSGTMTGNAGLRWFSAGVELLREAEGVADEALRRQLLAHAAASLAEASARLQNRMTRDVGRVTELAARPAGRRPATDEGKSVDSSSAPGSEELAGVGAPAGAEGPADRNLIACMLEALEEDEAAYREATRLRAEIYRQLAEPDAASTVECRSEAFLDAVIRQNAEAFESLSSWLAETRD